MADAATWPVWLCTYNVGMQTVNATDAEEMVRPVPDDVQLAIVGLQEVAHAESMGGAPLTWKAALVAVFHKHKKMVLLNKTFQATNHLMVFCNPEILVRVRRVQFKLAKNTLGGLTGHKGSIGIKLTLKNNESVVFVCSHFVHDVAQYEKRCEQFRDNRQCAFDGDRTVRAVFWIGDLNWRIEGEQHEVYKEIVAGRLDGLLARDQLNRARREKKAFGDYQEQQISFWPTYRLVMGADEYDLKRTPSWCDRVLYKGDATPVQYTSNRAVLGSDHCPVHATFIVPGCETVGVHSWDVVFEHVPTWHSTIPLTSRFQFRRDYWSKHGAYMDWVGVYPKDIVDCTQPAKWIYLMACYDQAIANTHFTVAEFVDLPMGEYRLGYFSAANNCLTGISKSFKVISPERPEQ